MQLQNVPFTYSKRLAGSMKVLASVDIVVMVTDKARSALNKEHHQLLNPLLWVATNKVVRSVVWLSSICKHITYPPGEAVTINSDIAIGSSRPWSFNNKTDRYPSSGIKKNWSKNPVAIAHLLCTCWRRCLISTVADIPKMSRNSSMFVNICESRANHSLSAPGWLPFNWFVVFVCMYIIISSIFVVDCMYYM